MTDRVYFYAESLSRSTTTTTDFSVVAVTKTFQPNDNKTYAIFWNAIIDGSTTGIDCKVRLINTTSSTVYSQYEMRRLTSSPSTDATAAGALALYTSGTGPAQQTIQIQIASATGSITTGYSEACILILELGADDVSTSSTSESVSSSSTYASKITVSISPPSAGDYLVITSADYKNTTGGADPQVRLNVNAGTFINIMSSAYYVNTGATLYWPYTPMARFVNVSTSQTAALQYASRWNNASVTIRNTYGVALRLDGFVNKYWAEDRTAHNSTSATYADSASTGAFTPSAVDHMVIASGTTTDTAADSIGVKIEGNGSDINTTIAQNVGETGYVENWVSLRKFTAVASSQTWKMRYARTASAAGTVTTDENVIAVLQLQDTPAAGGQPMSKRWGGVPFGSRNAGVW